MTSPETWPDFWQKITIAVVDKLFFGAIAAIAASWLQRRLEVFRRNQALTSETAKARLAAYHRLFASESKLVTEAVALLVGIMAIRDGNLRVTADTAKETMRTAAEKLRMSSFALVEALSAERFLINEAFADVILKIAELIERIAIESRQAIDDGTVDIAALAERHRNAFKHANEALIKSLPVFVRTPGEKDYFGGPDGASIIKALEKHLKTA